MNYLEIKRQKFLVRQQLLDLFLMKIRNIIQKYFQTNVCVKCKMESNDNLKEIDIKNHAWCYFNDVINGIDINFSDIGL